MLFNYIVSLILIVSPPTSHSDETPLGYAMRVSRIARDIVAVVDDEDDSDAFKRRDATRLAGVAFFESNFQLYVDRGDCDSPAWRETAFGRRMIQAHADCDLMQASSLWQIHAQEGIVLTERGWSRASNFTPEQLAVRDVYNGYDLATDRRLATRVALHMLRQAGGASCGYTGEHYPNCPKAALRQRFIDTWLLTHS